MLSLFHAPVLWWFVGLAGAAVIARGVWLYRASLSWPAADGVITRLDVERRNDPGGGHYFCATFSYDFEDPGGERRSGSWYKNFSSEEEAREFAARELPVGRAVVVRFNPKDPSDHDLEVDAWAYTNDRPTSLNL